MSNSYKYIDLNYTYIDPNTGILRNLQNISNADELIFVESSAVTKRLKELYEKPIRVKGIETLFEIHKYVFQDIYEWAGQKRKVEISKDGKQFFLTTYFNNAFKYIDSLVSEYKEISKNDKKQLANKLAEILDNINYLHPFREGNGRAQREFLRLLALEKGLKLILNPPDRKGVYERYMKGTIESDIQILSDLIYELITNNQ
ncbi:MAG: Fic family protein [Chitinophagaceae bacterium]|nr:Fic family protein [Chitinophagaceae bacterium]HRN48846.1 Fic family protein [Niabella sp.]